MYENNDEFKKGTLLPYDMAGRGKRDYIENYLNNYPELINQPWDGNGGSMAINNIISGKTAQTSLSVERLLIDFAGGAGTAASFIACPPLAAVTFLVYAYTATNHTDQYIKERKGWTLIEYFEKQYADKPSLATSPPIYNAILCDANKVITKARQQSDALNKVTQEVDNTIASLSSFSSNGFTFFSCLQKPASNNVVNNTSVYGL